MMKRVIKIKSFIIICIIAHGIVFGDTMPETNSHTLNGSISIGYSRIYNYEENNDSKIDAYLTRADLIVKYGKFLYETDFQYLNFQDGNRHFSHNSMGYSIYDKHNFPKTYFLVSYLHSEKLPVNILYNKDRSAIGFGCEFDMELETLYKGNARFTVTYFPTESVFYKSMDVGWNFGVIGFDVSGIGIRVPKGRFYSGFVWAIRYKW